MPLPLGRHFLVRTNHYSLKFLLDQRLSTVPQHQWISKLFGFDFEVENPSGRLNTVADALSRRDAVHTTGATNPGGTMVACALSTPTFALINDIHAAMCLAPDTQLLRGGDLPAPWWHAEGLLPHGSRVFMPDHDDLRSQVFLLAHITGHEGTQKTLHRLRADFYFPGDRALVHDWVRSCVTCQQNKTSTQRPVGLLQPLDGVGRHLHGHH